MIRSSRRLVFLATVAAGTACSGRAPVATDPATSPPRIVQPGAPGQASRPVGSATLDELRGARYTDADVRFMQGMIPHHAQALEMTALVRAHATTDAVRQMALRMEISQADEIALMQAWLRDHGEEVVARGMDHAMPGMDHGAQGGAMMPGMLSPEQMERLRTARGQTFDELFLEFMIQHHQGAVTMVRELFSSPGAGQESTVFKFAEDVEADQTMEIARMQGILAGLRGG